MKRYLVILTALLIVSALILGACSSPSTPTTTAPAQTTAKPTTSAPTSTAPTSAVPSTTAKPTTSAPASSPAAGVKTIKFPYSMPKGASIGRGFEWFGPAFEKASNGRYKVEIYPASSLVPVAAVYDSVKSNAVQMAYTSVGTFPKQFPLTLVAGNPSLGFPGESLKMYMAGHDAFREFVDTTPEIQNEFKDVQLLQPMILDPYNLVSKRKEVKSAADFRGMKVGGTGPKMEMITSNGGAKVQVVPPESYLNLDKGVIDAVFVTFGQVNDYKLYEITDFFTLQEFGCGQGIIIMNKGFYADMGAADQKILAETWRAAMDQSSQGSMDSVQAGKNAVLKVNKKLYTPTAAEAAAWEKAAEPAINLWRSDSKQMGATDATMDKILEKWKTIRTKYLALGK